MARTIWRTCRWGDLATQLRTCHIDWSKSRVCSYYVSPVMLSVQYALFALKSMIKQSIAKLNLISQCCCLNCTVLNYELTTLLCTLHYEHIVQEFEHRMAIWLDNMAYAVQYNKEHSKHWVSHSWCPNVPLSKSIQFSILCMMQSSYQQSKQ